MTGHERTERTRKRDSKGWFYMGVANMVTPYVLLAAIGSLAGTVYIHERAAILREAKDQSAEGLAAIAESVGTALGLVRDAQEEIRRMLAVSLQQAVDRDRRIERLETKADRASLGTEAHP